MLESKIESWYVKQFKARKIDCLKLHVKSWPDRICIARGGVCFVEFKRTGQRIVDPHQYARRADLIDKGFQVFEVNRISDLQLKMILDAIGAEEW